MDHFKNIGLESYASLPNIDTFTYIILKIIFVYMTPNLIKKVFYCHGAVKLS